MRSGRFKTAFIMFTFFSIAMGFLESAVVIYLREIYYPLGFRFPLTSMQGKMAITEMLREASTLIMLVSVAWLGGTNRRQRFAWFLYCFAVWDIGYYFFLKLLIGWPESLLTWDILFLLPLPWTGPVIAPVVVSLTMILMAGIVLYLDEKDTVTKGSAFAEAIITAGAFIVFLSFIWDFSAFILKQDSLAGLFPLKVIGDAFELYIPGYFNWWLFITGELVILSGLYVYFFTDTIDP